MLCVSRGEPLPISRSMSSSGRVVFQLFDSSPGCPVVLSAFLLIFSSAGWSIVPSPCAAAVACRVVVQGPGPGPRYGHVMSLVGQRFLLSISGNDGMLGLSRRLAGWFVAGIRETFGELIWREESESRGILPCGANDAI